MDNSVTSNAAVKSGSLSNAAVAEMSEALRRTSRRQFAADGFEDVEILDVSAGLAPILFT